MARGSKATYTDRQKRKARHIEESYEAKGVSTGRAEQIAWATVNKHSGGGEKSGSGRDKSERAKEASRQNSAQRAVETKRDQGKKGALENQSKESLLEIARAREITGRSQMKKQDLIAALRRSK